MTINITAFVLLLLVGTSLRLDQTHESQLLNIADFAHLSTETVIAHQLESTQQSHEHITG